MIAWVLGGLLIAYIAYVAFGFLLSTAEMAWQFWPKKGEKARPFVLRIAGFVLGWAMALAGVVAIVGSLTPKPRTPVLPMIGLGLAGLVVAVLGVLLAGRNTKT